MQKKLKIRKGANTFSHHCVYICVCVLCGVVYVYVKLYQNLPIKIKTNKFINAYFQTLLFAEKSGTQQYRN